MLNKKYRVLTVYWLVILVLTACNAENVDPFWEGEWTRTVSVPKNLSGRCYEERLVLKGKKWFLYAILHATDNCNNPYLELSYQGVLEEVHIQRNSAERQLTLQINDIQLLGMVDVAGTSRQAVPQGAIAAISDKYVPDEFQSFSQKLVFSPSHQQMQADYFKPILTLAIPSVKDLDDQSTYQRQSIR